MKSTTMGFLNNYTNGPVINSSLEQFYCVWVLDNVAKSLDGIGTGLVLVWPYIQLNLIILTLHVFNRILKTIYHFELGYCEKPGERREGNGCFKQALNVINQP